MSDILQRERQGAVETLTFNRPEVLNALNAPLADAITEAVCDVETDESVRCLVLRGGGGHFMAGGDLKSFRPMLEAPASRRQRDFEAFVHQIHPMIRTIRRMPKPVIASVEGAAGGFGLSLLMACDLAIAADTSIYTMAYCQIGTSPDGSSTWFLPRMVGLKKAMELALLSERFDAAESARLGIINRAVPADQLAAETAALAARLAAGPTGAYARTKSLLNRSVGLDMESQLTLEAEAFAACAASEDFVEGVGAFVAKRAPEFKGK